MPFVKLDQHTTAFTLEPIDDSATAPLLFFIPGNPGLAAYYTEYLTGIHKSFPQLAVVCPSHKGFNTIDDPSNLDENTAASATSATSVPTHYTLDEQIDHKIDILKAITDCSPAQRDLYLMGHSVGAWIAQRVAWRVHSRPELGLRLKFVGLVTPTIRDISISPKGRLLFAMRHFPVERLGQFLCHLLLRLPVVFRSSLLRLALGSAPVHAVVATESFLDRPAVVAQSLTLAREEMYRIGPDAAAEDVGEFWNEENPYRIWMYFAAGDHWVSDATRDALLRDFGTRRNVQAELGDVGGITHSFCVQHSDEFAGITAEALVEAGLPRK